MRDRLAPLLPRLRVGAVAGALLLLLALMLGNSTQAQWSADATVPGVQLRAGVLDVRVDGRDVVDDLTALSATDVLPGHVQAAWFTVTNAGTVPLDVGVGLGGTDLVGHGLAAALSLDVRVGDCSAPVTDHRLDPGESAQLCVEVTLPSSASPAVAGSSAALTLSVTAVDGGWSDTVPLTGSTLSTIALKAPTLVCDPLGLLPPVVQPVAGATAYRLLGTGGSLLATVSAGNLAQALSSVVGLVSAQAVYGSSDWVSAPATCP